MAFSDLARRLYYRAYRYYSRPRLQRISLDKLLLGGDCGIHGSKYARLIGDVKRTSTPIHQWPHSTFLKLYREQGESLFAPEALRETAYFQNALNAIEYVGNYFSARSEGDICTIGRAFIDRYNGSQGNGQVQYGLNGHSAPGVPVRVVRVWKSDYYMTIDGHHRLAIAYAKGESEIEVAVERPAQMTAGQELLQEVLWQGGRSELYQPVNLPECASWPLVRKCSDRYEMMQNGLRELGIGSKSAYLDIGASYGWFVREATSDGYLATGVERDPFAINVGIHLYGLEPDKLIRADCSRFLATTQDQWDFTSCFSVLHHFALGKGGVSAEEFLSLIDRVTKRVLFFDTGQAHEKWFRETLPQWTPDYIESWLRRYSTFKHIKRLGVDTDNEGGFQENYGRTLFMAWR